MRISLYDRLKPEHKQKLSEHYADLPFCHNEIVEVLSNEYFFTEVRYGIAADVEFICKINFFGNAFNE
tara:strand:+ start:336 stop:539 length:204 start_codon:yes stop_codon:yes gene_type:complete